MDIIAASQLADFDFKQLISIDAHHGFNR